MTVAISGRTLSIGAAIAGIGGVVAAIAAFLPWESGTYLSTTITSAGFDGGAGKTILVASIIAVACVVSLLMAIKLPIPAFRVAGIVVSSAEGICVLAGVIVLGIVLYNFGPLNDDLNLVKAVGGSGSLGIGYILDALGGAALIGGGIFAMMKRA